MSLRLRGQARVTDVARHAPAPRNLNSSRDCGTSCSRVTGPENNMAVVRG
jgi:hypothetical protein